MNDAFQAWLQAVQKKPDTKYDHEAKPVLPKHSMEIIKPAIGVFIRGNETFEDTIAYIDFLKKEAFALGLEVTVSGRKEKVTIYAHTRHELYAAAYLALGDFILVGSQKFEGDIYYTIHDNFSDFKNRIADYCAAKSLKDIQISKVEGGARILTSSLANISHLMTRHANGQFNIPQPPQAKAEPKSP